MAHGRALPGDGARSIHRGGLALPAAFEGVLIVLHALAGILALVLLVYLFVALIRPEWF